MRNNDYDDMIAELKAELGEKRMNLAELAKRSGIARTSIRACFRGEGEPSMRNLIIIAQASGFDCFADGRLLGDYDDLLGIMREAKERNGDTLSDLSARGLGAKATICYDLQGRTNAGARRAMAMLDALGVRFTMRDRWAIQD